MYTYVHTYPYTHSFINSHIRFNFHTKNMNDIYLMMLMFSSYDSWWKLNYLLSLTYISMSLDPWKYFFHTKTLKFIYIYTLILKHTQSYSYIKFRSHTKKNMKDMLFTWWKHTNYWRLGVLNIFFSHNKHTHSYTHTYNQFC